MKLAIRRATVIVATLIAIFLIMGIFVMRPISGSLALAGVPGLADYFKDFAKEFVNMAQGNFAAGRGFLFDLFGTLTMCLGIVLAAFFLVAGIVKRRYFYIGSVVCMLLFTFFLMTFSFNYIVYFEPGFLLNQIDSWILAVLIFIIWAVFTYIIILILLDLYYLSHPKEETKKAVTVKETIVVESQPTVITETVIINKYIDEDPISVYADAEDDGYLPLAIMELTEKNVEKPVKTAAKSKPTVFVAADDGDDTKKVSRNRIPFIQKLMESDEETWEMYDELKAEFLSYGLKSRISIAGDSYRAHTKTYVMLTIAGKNIKLYFALNPKKYTDSTIPFTDSGHLKIHEETPFTFKVKSALSIKRAKQLIADACSLDNLEQGKIVNKIYAKILMDTERKKRKETAKIK